MQSLIGRRLVGAGMALTLVLVTCALGGGAASVGPPTLPPLGASKGQPHLAARVAAQKAPSLEGTSWDVTIRDWLPEHHEFEFLAGGKLRYSHHAAMGERRTYENASWAQEGDSLSIEIHDKHSELRGTIRGDRIEGTISNAEGKRSTWVARRKRTC